ncbi:EF-hand domain-containing protein 1-like [Macrobrachium rosenbergii]|uniref:EF-hand domain-containing protein 1-like n=1 Tax=Macrobrachium rosenbergii TaxID=79674 RepID=UPI0034D6B28C
MAGLPLLPGYSLYDPTALQKPIRQSLGWKKGVPLVQASHVSLLSEEDHDDLIRQERKLQFADKGRRSRTPPKFLPEWAVLEKKVLRFSGYFAEHIEGGPQVYRIRPVVICYYLLDDAIMVIEPKTPNSGLEQGRLLSRQRVPHPDGGFWHWTQLNLGMTLSLYGRKFVICDCDPFTKEYLVSEGTELKNPLPIPQDPYNLLRRSRAESPSRGSDLRPRSAPLAPPSLRGVVLKFDTLVEGVDCGQPAVSPAVLLYRPEDLTVELRQPSYFDHTEIKKFSPVILRAVKVPLSDTRKSGFVDIGEESEVGDWIMPRHLIPPANVNIFGRRVMVVGCDDYTSQFLKDFYGVEHSPPMKNVETRKPDESGSSGKTQSDIVPRPKIRRGLLNAKDAAILRFSAKLDSPDGEENDRSFIVTYHLIDDTFEITELPKPGGLGGRVLSRSHVPKPVPSENEKGAGKYAGRDIYNLDDFYIGSKLDVWGRHYIITGADRHVLNYVREHENEVSPQLYSSLADFFGQAESTNQQQQKETGCGEAE